MAAPRLAPLSVGPPRARYAAGPLRLVAASIAASLPPPPEPLEPPEPPPSPPSARARCQHELRRRSPEPPAPPPEPPPVAATRATTSDATRARRARRTRPELRLPQRALVREGPRAPTAVRAGPSTRPGSSGRRGAAAPAAEPPATRLWATHRWRHCSGARIGGRRPRLPHFHGMRRRVPRMCRLATRSQLRSVEARRDR